MIKETIDALNLSFAKEDIDSLQDMISNLYVCGVYNRLIKDFYKERDVSNFYSKLFELSIACAIERAGLISFYEASVRDGDNSSIDFKVVDDNGFSLFLEAKLLQDVKIKNDIQMQLACRPYYSAHMDGKRERTEILRLQSDILSKVQKRDGALIKFTDPGDMCANVVAIDVGDLILECIDPYDCMLACYGDNGVREHYLKRGIVGLFEQTPVDIFSIDQNLKKRFANAQRVLNGVVFLFRSRSASRISTDIRYFFVSNRFLTSNDKETRLRSMFDKLFPRYS